MRHKRGFHFHGAQAMTRHIKYVIHASHNPEVSVLILARAVTREVHARNLRPVVSLVTFRISPNGSQHRRPRFLDDEISTRTEGNRVSFECYHIRGNAGE